VFSAREQWRDAALATRADAFLTKSAHRDTTAAALLAANLTAIGTDA
jgi:hypothetical protein